MEVPLLPVNSASVQLKRYTLWLGYMDWLEVVSEADLLLNGFGVKVGGRSGVQWAAFLGNVNVDDLLGLNVEDWAKVQRVGVLEVIDAWAVVHQGLLES